MNLEPLAQKLSDDGIATAGVDLFIHNMPSNVTKAVLLLSNLTGTPIDFELPGYRRTSFQAIIRHTDYVQGLALANEVSEALTFKSGESILDTLHIKHILPRHEPVVFPVSEGDFLEISVNFDAVYIQN